MQETLNQIGRDFVVLDLGAAHSDTVIRGTPWLGQALTIVEVDLQGEEASGGGEEFRRIRLRKGVAGSEGRRFFQKRRFAECSSFLDPKRELLRDYGIENYFDEVERTAVDCEPVSRLLKQHGIERVDLFKTDLEGLDFEVLASAPDLVGASLCVQCELRFQPIYEGEASFCEAVTFLAGLGFELVWMNPVVWKYATRHRDLQRDGRYVYADTIFFLEPGKVRQLFGDKAPQAFAKQIILARLLGLENFAEHIFEREIEGFSPPVRGELQAFVRPSFNLVRQGLALLNAMPFGWIAIGGLRRLCKAASSALALYPDRVLSRI